MLDGLSITKKLNGQSVNTTFLDHIGSWKGGNSYKIRTSSFSTFSKSLENVPVVKLYNDKLKIEGSLPFLLNGNTLEGLTISEIRDLFEKLGHLLGVDLKCATVNYFEFGAAINIEFPCKEFIHHHLSFPKMDSADYNKKGKYFQDKLRRIKIYDAVFNTKYKLSLPVKSKLKVSGQYLQSANFVKVEIQYKNPCKYFGKIITVEDLLDIDFYAMCSEDFLYTYNQIQKTGLKIPKTAKELTSTKILAIALKEIEQITGIDAKLRVEKLINNSTYLKKTQKYDRRNTIRKAFSGLSADNPYDISNLLGKATEKFLQKV